MDGRLEGRSMTICLGLVTLTSFANRSMETRISIPPIDIASCILHTKPLNFANGLSEANRSFVVCVPVSLDRLSHVLHDRRPVKPSQRSSPCTCRLLMSSSTRSR